MLAVGRLGVDELCVVSGGMDVPWMDDSSASMRSDMSFMRAATCLLRSSRRVSTCASSDSIQSPSWSGVVSWLMVGRWGAVGGGGICDLSS